jgi:hypothetical protein
MTLPRKGTRLIVVDEIAYRWTVAPNDEPSLAIVVEHAEKPGQRLVRWVGHGTILRPGLVREAILDGLRAGWNAGAVGRDIVRRGAFPGEEGGAVKQCPCCDYFTLDTRGQYDICPICFWEDDGLDVDALDTHSGPNHLTLREARANFARLGACDEAALAHVLPAERRAGFVRRVRP